MHFPSLSVSVAGRFDAPRRHRSRLVRQQDTEPGMRSLTIEPLTPDRIDQAFPLIQMVRPRLSVADWRAHAHALLARPDSGITLLVDDRGLILGLFCWTVESHPDHGTTLDAEDFVALDIVGSNRSADALADALEDTARRRGCGAVHTNVQCAGGGASGLVDRLSGLGHRMESLRLCKQLSRA